MAAFFLLSIAILNFALLEKNVKTNGYQKMLCC